MVYMPEDPYSSGKIGVTIKVPESKKYAGDNPWFVFEGSNPTDLKTKIGATFGLEIDGLNLGDVVINAQRHVTGLGAVAHGLGGTVISSGSNEAAPAPKGGGGDVWSQASQAKTEAPAQEVDPILAAIDGTRSVAELQQVWAENQTAFNENPSYMDAYRAKGKALTAN